MLFIENQPIRTKHVWRIILDDMGCEYITVYSTRKKDYDNRFPNMPEYGCEIEYYNYKHRWSIKSRIYDPDKRHIINVVYDGKPVFEIRMLHYRTEFILRMIKERVHDFHRINKIMDGFSYLDTGHNRRLNIPVACVGKIGGDSCEYE